MNDTTKPLGDDQGFISVMYPVYTTIAPLVFVVVIFMLLFYIIILTLK